MKVKGTITISRASDSHRDQDYIHIRIRDEEAAISFAELEVSFENWGRALSGQGYVDCEIEVRGLDRIGTKFESKTVLVPWTGDTWSRNGQADALEAQAKFEVDGWRAREGDIFNHHHRRRDGVNVVFTRNVPKEGT